VETDSDGAAPREPRARGVPEEGPAVPPADAPVDAVVFDLFDTLVDLDFGHLPLVDVGGRSVRSTYPLVHEALAQVVAIPFERFTAELLAVDRDIAEGAHRRCEEVSTRERFARLLGRLGIDRDRDAVLERLRAAHMSGLRAGASAAPRAADVLRQLRARFRIGICSNFTDAATALAILDDAGLRDHVDAIAISETVGRRKPRSEPFRAVLRDLAATPERAVHVGDQLVEDVAGPSAIGMRSAWAVRRIADREERIRRAPDARPTWIVTDLAELPATLRA